MAAAPGADLSPQGVQDIVRGELAGYKTPRLVRVVERVPRGANGKPNYDEARRLFEP